MTYDYIGGVQLIVFIIGLFFMWNYIGIYSAMSHPDYVGNTSDHAVGATLSSLAVLQWWMF